MIETIGKVTLDLTKYPGEDFYCDGKVEDEILQIVKNHSTIEYGKIIEERKSWPILYHLSPLRENIVEFLPISKEEKVLEVGSGCGAITGAFTRKAGQVTCVDLSKKRSTINAHRHAECDNLTIHVGNFKDIEPDLANDYDYICLIGVFEYGKSYIGGTKPYVDFLNILKKHLKENGRIVIAIENKLGLKYFAGCREDHLGTFFSSIENYNDGGGVRTFSRRGLEKIFRECEIQESTFYYPYPDYKFPTTIYSDVYLPGKGELSNNYRNFDRDRMLLFDEKAAFDGIVEDGYFSVFSNSYIAILGKAFEMKYVKYSNDRVKEYQIKTEITRNQEGQIGVKKYPLSEEAISHIQGISIAYENLVEKYKEGRLKINCCTLEEDGSVAFEYVDGTPLSELMDACLEKDDLESFYRYFDEYVERVGYNQEFPVADFDVVFSNILVSDEQWTLIDYEWTFGKQIDIKEVAFRAIYCYLLEDEKRNKLNVDIILEKLGISLADAENYRRQEMAFQKFVTGNQKSMHEIRELIGEPIHEPVKWMHKYRNMESKARVQIYYDEGEGYLEETSEFLEDPFIEETLIEIELEVSGNIKSLRIDPYMSSCICKIQELTFNGVSIPLQDKKTVVINGKKVKGTNTMIFATEDPNVNLQLEGLAPKNTNILYGRIEVHPVPIGMAEDLIKGMKKIL